MRLRSTVIVALVLSVAASMNAQERQEESAATQPDFSNSALLEFVLENPDLVDEQDDGFVIDSGLVYRRGHWIFRYIPIAAPLLVSFAPDAHVTAMPTVDPIALTGTHVPYTQSSFRDRWEERRIRRTLKRNVEAANRKQNQ